MSIYCLLQYMFEIYVEIYSALSLDIQKIVLTKSRDKLSEVKDVESSLIFLLRREL